jgi:hypothetical protein
MHPYPYGVSPPAYYGYPPAAGLPAVIGGAIHLATTTLYSGARLLRTIVENSVWEAEHPRYYGYAHAGCSPCMHVCHVHCIPETYECHRCC